MADIIELGVDVDSTTVVSANKNLENLKKTAMGAGDGLEAMAKDAQMARQALSAQEAAARASAASTAAQAKAAKEAAAAARQEASEAKAVAAALRQAAAADKTLAAAAKQAADAAKQKASASKAASAAAKEAAASSKQAAAAARDLATAAALAAAKERELTAALHAEASAARGAAAATTEAAAANRLLAGGGASMAAALAQGVGQLGAMAGIMRMLPGPIGAVAGALTALVGGQIIGGLMQTTMTLQQIEMTLTAVTGSAARAAEEFDYVFQTADAMGQNVEVAAKSYSRLLAAADGAGLELETTRTLFEGITAAATTFGLTQYELEGALNAVQQMISKGSVQAEELRGQLGERLPGAYNLAAEAMGMTTRELSKALELGQVSATEFVEAFGPLLQERYGNFAQNAETSAKALGELENAFFKLKEAIVKSGFQEALIDIMTMLTEMLQLAPVIAMAQALGVAFKLLADAVILVWDAFKLLVDIAGAVVSGYRLMWASLWEGERSADALAQSLETELAVLQRLSDEMPTGTRMSEEMARVKLEQAEAHLATAEAAAAEQRQILYQNEAYRDAVNTILETKEAIENLQRAQAAAPIDPRQFGQVNIPAADLPFADEIATAKAELLAASEALLEMERTAGISGDAIREMRTYVEDLRASIEAAEDGMVTVTRSTDEATDATVDLASAWAGIWDSFKQANPDIMKNLTEGLEDNETILGAMVGHMRDYTTAQMEAAAVGYDMLQASEDQIAILEAEAQYGEDSRQAAETRWAIEERILRTELDRLPITEATRDAIVASAREAYELENATVYVSDAARSVASQMVAIAQATSGAAGNTYDLASAFEAVLAAVNALLGPMDSLLGKLGGVISAIGRMSNLGPAVGTVVSNLGIFGQNISTSAIESLSSGFGGLADNLRNAWSAAGEGASSEDVQDMLFLEDATGGGGGGGGGQTAAERLAEDFETLTKSLEDYNAETAMMGASGGGMGAMEREANDLIAAVEDAGLAVDEFFAELGITPDGLRQLGVDADIARAKMEGLIGVGEEVAQSLGSVFENFLMTGKMDFGTFVDDIKGMFARMLADMVAKAAQTKIIMPMLSAFAGAPTGAAAGELTGGTMSAVGSLFGTAGSSFASGLTSVISGAVNGGVSGALGAVTGALGGVGTGLAGVATALGAVALPIAAGYALFTGIKGSTSVIDSGINLTASSGRASASGFETTQTSRFWGLSKSTDTDTVGLGAAEAEIEQQVKGVTDGVKVMAASLGVGGEAFKGFSETVQISTKGLTDEEIAEALQQAYLDIANSMAASVKGLEKFALAGEDAYTTLMRLSLSLEGVNAALAATGRSGFAETTAGADKAFDLAELFGGLDAFAAATSSFVDTFYTEAQKIDLATEEVTAELAALNKEFPNLDATLPKTREELVATANAVDLSTEAGREYYAFLVQNAEAFDMILPPLEEATEGIEDLATELEKLQGAVDKASAEVALYEDILAANPQSLSDLDAYYSAREDLLAAQQAAELERLEELGVDTTLIKKAQNAQWIALEQEYNDAVTAMFEETTTKIGQLEVNRADLITELTRRYNEAAAAEQALADARLGLAASDLAPGNEMTQLAELQRQFDAAAKAAAGGDAAAATEAAQLAQQLLQQGQVVYGSSAEYGDLFASTNKTLTSLEASFGKTADTINATLTAQSFEDITQKTTNQLLAALDRIDQSIAQQTAEQKKAQEQAYRDAQRAKTGTKK